MLQGTHFTPKDAGRNFVASCKDRYFIFDNLEEKRIPAIEHRDEIYNNLYSYTTVVVRGTLHMRINGLNVDVKADEIITITPCMNIEILDSQCLYFCILTLNHVISDIYDRCGVGPEVKIRSYTFNHYSFDKQITEELTHQYNILKREYQRPDYEMKEASIRALTCALIMKFYIYRPKMHEISHFDENIRIHQLYNRFLELLCLYCKSERSVQFYANKLHITPKYLSNITNTFTHRPASVVIDHYVIFNIQQTLYTNDLNIKKVSEMYHFPNQSFFGRYFKRLTGMSPNSYLKLINKD